MKFIVNVSNEYVQDYSLAFYRYLFLGHSGATKTDVNSYRSQTIWTQAKLPPGSCEQALI